MKLLVAIKRCVDYNARIRVKSDQKGIDLNGVKFSMNPFCEIAVEEALRLKEKNFAGEIVAVSLGPKSSQETLRTALAMGVDRAIHISTDAEMQPLGVAKALREVVHREQPHMVIMGKQAIDDDCNQTGQLLAGMLRWPQATFASEVTIDEARKKASVTREVDGGLESIGIFLPAVVTADLRLNEPRYATLPNIMKAKKKPMETIAAEDLGVDMAPRLEALRVAEPARREGGRVLSSVDELLEKLRGEAKVLP
uniref:Electron transfer flavoprotein subunit beta n=1 Tax=Tetraselmis sp. GSL018 TaxID=582737 RepID=A0A061RWR5_9CHLO|mmetsp:Transcript_36885/g.87665  ORF Transcript_36885/g.87665 Transcript_36885/m.87665 type:complete len:253 (+) Transcript_36885:187-945(+)|eukprot:CAMPEP_0177615968 /NCGR_PEP_ID=MMETSP0419_2-20121207/23830_1 /TAXON_ID=582737 /ORGANISM="Tetraselmis sp., Strain GSL018" /LENGTH=252 /DNA_ID=CAMNT_0019113845 /DNA_START=158 /DNA_END=916 /DNA_ORIENTATION=-